MEKRSWHSDFADLEQVAFEFGIPIMRVSDVNTEPTLELLRRLAPDVLLVVGWSRICGREFRNSAKIGALGFHPTLLPNMRGRSALAWTILLELETSGGTLFWLDDGVDSGDIAAQRSFQLPPGSTLEELIDRQRETLSRMIPPLFEQLAGGEVPGEPQDEKNATYAAARRPEDGEIVWAHSSYEIERLIRAVSRPYPGAFTYLKGRKLVVWSAKVVKRSDWFAQTGQMFAEEDGFPIVRCGEGTDLMLIEYSFDEDSGRPRPALSISGQPKLGRVT
ncbi:MAG: methionyl-tRNA formyltransferase [Pseudomonadota bacterium]|nr:methionyl-tRNA formyltransferase [Pseudomonadota bacterium]